MNFVARPVAVAHDTINTLMGEFDIPLKEPVSSSDSNREIICTFVSGLFNKSFDETAASEKEKTVADVLRISEGGLDERTCSRRLKNLCRLGRVDTCIVLLAGLKITEMMYQDKKIPSVRKRAIQFAEKFYRKNLRSLAVATPLIVNMVGERADFIERRRLIDEYEVPLFEPVSPYEADRDIILKFVRGLTGQRYDEEYASEIENCIYDILLIADGGVDRQESQLRLTNMQQFGQIATFSALLTGLKVADIMLQDIWMTQDRKREILFAEQFYRKNLQSMRDANPHIVDMVRSFN